MKGVFITFEGIDGAGKTTQLDRFTASLQAEGRAVLRSREPGGDSVAEAIRSILLDPSHRGMTPLTEAYLYAASRAQHVRQVLRPALQTGTTVICDRYLDSSVAYQGFGRQLGWERIHRINEEAVDGLYPDWTVILLLDPVLARQRMSERPLDRIEQEKLDFHRRVYDGFQRIALMDPERIYLADAAQDVETIAQGIWSAWKNRESH